MNWLIGLGGVLGALGVAMGAAGAHALEGRLDAKALGYVETAVQYQLWHALAAVLAGVLMLVKPGWGPPWAGALWLIGILLFCGALYALAFTGWRPAAHAAPFGGLCLIAGWLVLALWAALTVRASG